jgi:DNA-directed RNA polymerase subunit M/transcription elongation factor TFIIS
MMIDPRLQALIKDVSDSSDDTGREDDRTVVNKAAISALADYTGQMGQRDFVKSSGMKCPFCGSDFIMYSGQPVLTDGTCKRACTCGDCEESWNEVYRLSGYTIGVAPEVSKG